jgi:hypothetical protein
MSRMVLIYVCVNVVLYGAGVKVVENEQFLDRFVDFDSEGEVRGVDEDFKGSTPETFDQEGGGSDVLSFIDSVGAVSDFIFFILNIIFTPLGLFFSLGLPPIVGLIFAVPLLVAGVLSVMTFVRSG